ncbi:MAG: hypothetical protein U0984_16505 [Prosthecobacter sp.]|nr:hypothetical protein [Prosthecobacter sp.]
MISRRHCLTAAAFTMTLVFVNSCQTPWQPKPLLQKVLILPYDDFGPEPQTTSWLGPREPNAKVIIHYGQSEQALRRRYPAPPCRYTTVKRAVFHVARTLRRLPDGDPQKARVHVTLAALRSFERDRQIALTSSPPFTGRGAFRRMSLYP